MKHHETNKDTTVSSIGNHVNGSPDNLKLIEGDLTNTYRLLDAVAASSMDIIILTDTHGVLLYVSNTIVDNLGYTSDEIMSMKSLDWLLSRDYLPKRLTTMSSVTESRVATIKDSKEREHAFQVTVTQAPMKDIAYLYTLRDVTGFEILHSELDSLREQQLVSHESSNADVVLDEELSIIQLSNKAEKVFGIYADNVIGQHLFDIVNDLRDSFFENECRKSLSNKTARSFETSIGIPQNEINYSIDITPIAEGLTINITAVSKTKQILNTYRNSVRHFQLLSEYIKDVFWITSPDPHDQVEYVSPAYEEVWGFSAAELYNDPDAWLQFIVEEDRERIIIESEQFLERGEDSVLEFRVIRPDGVIRWVNMHGYIVRSASGEIEYNVGIAQDITDRKETEYQLRMSEERYRTLLDSVDFAVTIVDCNGVFNYVNEVSARDFGMGNAEEVVGKTLWELLPKNSADALFKKYRESIDKIEPVFLDEQYIINAEKGRLFELHIQPIKKTYGECNQVLTMAFDITELKNTQEKYKAIVEGANFVIVINDSKGVCQFANKYAAQALGIQREEIIGKSLSSIFPKHIANRLQELVNSVIESGIPASDLMQTYYGEKWRWEEAHILPIKDADGVCRQAMIMVHDITNSKNAEEALRASEVKYRFLFNKMLDGFALHEMIFDENNKPVDFKYIEVNPAFERLTGIDSKRLIGKRINEVFDCKIDQNIIDLYGEVVLTGEPIHFEHKHGNSDTHFEVSAFRTQENQFAVIIKDITERVNVERNTKESEKLLREAQKMARLGNWKYKVHTKQIIWSDEMYRLHDVDPEDVDRSKDMNFYLVHHDDRKHLITLITNALKNGKPFEYIYRANLRSGQKRYLQIHGQCEYAPDSTLVALSGTALDVTDQMLVQKALRESEEQYRALFKHGGTIGLLLDPEDGHIVDANDNAVAFYGYSYAELTRMHIHSLNTMSEDEINTTIKHALNCKQMHFEFKHRLADETVRDVEVYVSPVTMRDKIYLYSVIIDVTEQKQLEIQFVQAQRMETIGRLAGGIAHDFNNLLTVIRGNAEIALMSLTSDNTLYEDISEILAGAERASNLTRQLLAFSRRQVIEPKVVVLNDIIVDMNSMLRRLIGEEYQLVTQLSRDIGVVFIDPGQVEQVITNLVVNSRDAMPKGGQITITTENVTFQSKQTGEYNAIEPGEYVEFSVIDTGTGIDESTKQFIFEPFFTTKEKGRGTGLGLSTCYGIVTQNNGHIVIDTELGQGTTMKVLLPLKRGELTEAEQISETSSPKTGEGETILVVEDDENLNRMITKILEEHGYQILKANNGEDALDIIASEGLESISLILSDVVMPRMGGNKLAEHIRELSDDAKILFVSGYSDHAIECEGILNRNSDFLSKPFTPASLLNKVCDMITK